MNGGNYRPVQKCPTVLRREKRVKELQSGLNKVVTYVWVIRIRGNSISCTEWESELNWPYAMSYTQIHTLILQTYNSVNDPNSVSEGHSEFELNCDF